jgi:hypothetical protein
MQDGECNEKDQNRTNGEGKLSGGRPAWKEGHQNHDFENENPGSYKNSAKDKIHGTTPSYSGLKLKSCGHSDFLDGHVRFEDAWSVSSAAVTSVTVEPHSGDPRKKEYRAADSLSLIERPGACPERYPHTDCVFSFLLKTLSNIFGQELYVAARDLYRVSPPATEEMAKAGAEK